MVAVGVLATEGKFESSFAIQVAVACAGIAAGFREDGHDIDGELRGASRGE